MVSDPGKITLGELQVELSKNINNATYYAAGGAILVTLALAIAALYAIHGGKLVANKATIGVCVALAFVTLPAIYFMRREYININGLRLSVVDMLMSFNNTALRDVLFNKEYLDTHISVVVMQILNHMLEVRVKYIAQFNSLRDDEEAEMNSNVESYDKDGVGLMLEKTLNMDRVTMDGLASSLYKDTRANIAKKAYIHYIPHSSDFLERAVMFLKVLLFINAECKFFPKQSEKCKEAPRNISKKKPPNIPLNVVLSVSNVEVWFSDLEVWFNDLKDKEFCCEWECSPRAEFPTHE